MFNKKVIAGAIVLAGLILFYVYLLLNGLAYQQNAATTPQANLDVIPAASIPTMDNSLLFITPTSTPPASQNPGSVSIQKFVKIEGTGGVGLRIRREPGKTSETVFIANESEVFIVIGGPEQKDDITWWQLTTPYDETRNGWASGDYLVAVEQN